MYGDRESFSRTNPILDSGTSVLVLPDSIYDKVIDDTERISCSSDADCTISIEMDNGVTLQAPGIVTCSWAGLCAPDIGWIEKGSSTTIGYVVLRNYFTHFDRAGMTIGFAKGTPECVPDKLPKLSSHARSGSRHHGGGIAGSILDHLFDLF